jgi:predicted TIM-barrel fold metal-dependent hydrolase
MYKIFDGHFHIIDPAFPLVENNGFIPDYYVIKEYREELRRMDIDVIGGAVVSGSFQGYHQDYFNAALTELGENFIGITQLPIDISDQEIRFLDATGIKGIRFNLYRGIDTSLDDIERLSKRVYNLCNWKTEFYLNVDTVDTNLDKLIHSLPKVSIDHLGMGRHSIDKLKKYLSNNIPIRVTGFGRLKYDRNELKSILVQLHAENSEGLIFGTDLPSTRADYRFSINDILLLEEIFNAQDVEKILYKNGMKWYLDK